MRHRFDSFELDWDNRQLWRGDTPIPVEPKVLQFLNLMLESRGRLVTRDEIERALWPSTSVGQNALSRIVKQARKTIGDHGGEPRLILTRRCHGYLFTADVETLTNACRSRRAASSHVHAQSQSRVDDTSQDTTTLEPRNMGRAIRIEWILPELRETILERPGAIVFGRQSSCDQVLDGLGVSRRHAQCGFQGPIAIVRDLASRNGTYVNGQLVNVAPLVANDVIRIGSWLGIVRSHSSRHRDDFRQLASNYWGRTELMGLLQTAMHVVANEGTLHLCGEPGVGKSALAAAIARRIDADAEPVTLRCHTSMQPRSRSGECQQVDDVTAMTSAMTSCSRRIVIFDNVECLDAERGSRLTEQLLVLKAEGRLPTIITTSRLSLAEFSGVRYPPPPVSVPLNGGELSIPPLRERRGDIFGLLAAFCAEQKLPCCKLSAHAGEDFLMYPWPTNTAELRRAADDLLMIGAEKARIDVHDLPPKIRGVAASGAVAFGVRGVHWANL